MHITNHILGFGVAAVFGLCATAPASAAPVLSNTTVLKSSVDNTITEVRYVRRDWARAATRAAVATGVGLAIAGAATSYAYGYPYGYGYQSYSYGYPSNYGYAPYSTSYAGYTPYSYNYGYSGYSGYSGYGYNYGYTPGYYGYGVRRAVRGVARPAYYRR